MDEGWGSPWALTTSMEVTKHLMGTRSRRHRHRKPLERTPGLDSMLPVRGTGSIPDQGAEIPHVAWPKKTTSGIESLYYLFLGQSTCLEELAWRERLLGEREALMQKETLTEGERTP